MLVITTHPASILVRMSLAFDGQLAELSMRPIDKKACCSDNILII
jgi:hypothetical protein